MDEFRRVQNDAASSGISGTGQAARGLSDVGSSVALTMYKKVMTKVQELKDAKTAEQETVASVASRIGSSPTSELTTEQNLLEKQSQKSKDKPLIKYIRSPKEKAELLDRIETATTAFKRQAQSPDRQVSSDALSKVTELANLIDELGATNYVEHNIESTLNNSKFFSEHEPERDELEILIPTVEGIEPVTPNTEKEVNPKVKIPESSTPTNKISRTSSTTEQQPLSPSNERQKVVQIVGTLDSAYNDFPAYDFDFMESPESKIQEELSPEDSKPAPQSKKHSELISQSSNKSSAETFVSVYKAETFEIRRKGYIVSIFDSNSDSKEPIFKFEQRGQKVKVIEDKITKNREVYNKFEIASKNLETMRSRGQGVKEIFSDKTHRAQVAVLGELAPRGSTAIATAHLLTGDAEKVRTITTKSGRRISYERQVRMKEDSGQPYDVVTVSREGVPPGNSIIAMSEDGSILSQNHPSDYAELKGNYDVAKKEHDAARQSDKTSKESSKTLTLRNRGGAER
jgi:hypothetical protein